MRIAFTGATGFVGQSTFQTLLTDGHQLSILVRQPAKHRFPAQVRVVAGELDNHAALKDLVYDAECVVHGAGAISAVSEAAFFKTNFGGTQRIFEASVAAGVKRFIHISSLAARMPTISPYAASKRAGEDFLLSSSDAIEILILRPSAVYGPADRATLPLLAALQKPVAFIPGTATSRFSLIHVADLAAIVAAAVHSQETGIVEVDDLSGGHSWAEVAEISFNQAGVPKHITYLPRALVYCVALVAEMVALVKGQASLISRAKLRELYCEDWVVRGDNWPRKNAIALSQGLPDTLLWYQQEGWLPPFGAGAKSRS